MTANMEFPSHIKGCWHHNTFYMLYYSIIYSSKISTFPLNYVKSRDMFYKFLYLLKRSILSEK
jgi:hypothetical protein